MTKQQRIKILHMKHKFYKSMTNEMDSEELFATVIALQECASELISGALQPEQDEDGEANEMDT